MSITRDPPDDRAAGVDVSMLLGTPDLPDSSLWRQVVDTMNEGLMLLDPERRIVYLNKKAEAIIGRSIDEVRGAPCVEAINCPRCHCRCRLFEDGSAEGVEVSIFGHSDGQRRVLSKNMRLLRDGQGRVLGGIETFSDISREVKERQDNERYTALLFHEKSRTEAMLESIDEGVFVAGADLRILTCAARTARIVGLDDPAKAAGKSIWQFLGLEKDLFEVNDVSDLDGQSFRVTVAGTSDPHPARLSFRRIRGSDNEILGLLRPVRRVSDTEPLASTRDQFHGIVSRSARMREIFRLIDGAAQSHASVLIEGESGVGKELVARAIHSLSLRRSQPFYAVNCATFSGSLLLSELFGHERGAFTGAYRTTQGKLALAGEGTLFLDEVSEIPLHYQSVLLRVLEDRHFERVGGQERIALGARIVSATNKQLNNAVTRGTFREDLYFRLRVIPITVPPLRERPEDIPLLASYFAKHPGVNLTGRELRFSDSAIDALSRYHWPGNVRELRNTIEYLCFVGNDVVEADDLPSDLRRRRGTIPTPTPLPALLSEHEDDERARLTAALEQSRYRKQEAARLLGMDRTTLWRKMKRLGIP